MDGYVFIGCTNLRSVTLGTGITTIANYTFNGCINLSNVKILGVITSIGSQAFNNCDGLTNFVLPASIISVEESAFRNCDNLVSITMESATPPTFNSNCIPTNVTTIYVPEGATDEYRAALTNYNSTWGASVSIVEVT